jgi:hypothetical protein
MTERHFVEERAKRQKIQERKSTPFPSYRTKNLSDFTDGLRKYQTNDETIGSESLAQLDHTRRAEVVEARPIPRERSPGYNYSFNEPERDSRKTRPRDDNDDSSKWYESVEPARTKPRRKIRTGKSLPPEPPLPEHSVIVPAANEAWEAVQQGENAATVTSKGDSEEGRPCTQPARSTPIVDTATNAELRTSLHHQVGPSCLLPEPRESLKLSHTTVSQELEGQSNTKGKGDATEEPTSVVPISSPAGASNGSPAMLIKRNKSEEIESHEVYQADACADASSKTPPLAGSVQDCENQLSVAANSPSEPSRCDSMIAQESVLDVDTDQQNKNDSMPKHDRFGREVVLQPLRERSTRLASAEASWRLTSTKASWAQRRVDEPEETLYSEDTVAPKPPDVKKSTKKSAVKKSAKKSAVKKSAKKSAVKKSSKIKSAVKKSAKKSAAKESAILIGTDLHNNDVICGRSAGKYRNHPANVEYLKMLKYKVYPWSSTEDVTRLVEELIGSITGTTPPGRFLKTQDSGGYEVMDKQNVEVKVRRGLLEYRVMTDPAPMVPHEKDPAREYIEELGFLFHDPPMPDKGIRRREQAVSAENLPPLPKAPPVVIPAKTECIWTFCEESRVLLVNFKGVDKVSPADKRAFAEMLQRDDITVVAEGLLGGIDPRLLTLEYMAVVMKDYHRFRRYEKDSSGDFVTYKEKKGHLSMKLSDFLEYLRLRKKALNPSRSGKAETAFSFTDREHKQVNVDVTDPLYLIDMDMPNRLPHVFSEFSQALKIPEILPGGEWCMTNEVIGQPFVALLCVVHPEVFLIFFCFIHTL